MRLRRRGVALLTALFLSVVMLGVVTVMVYQANQNFLATRRNTLQTQADLLARAAEQQAEKSMNDSGDAVTWIAAHCSSHPIVITDPSGASASAWVQPTHPPRCGMWSIVGSGSVSSVVSTTEQVIFQQHPLVGNYVVRSPCNGYTQYMIRDTCFTPWLSAISCCISWNYVTGKSSTGQPNPWKMFYPPVAWFWKWCGGCAGYVGHNNLFTKHWEGYCGCDGGDYKWANNLTHPTGDTSSHMFSVWQRSGANQVFWYCERTVCCNPYQNPTTVPTLPWKLMPPVPNYYYDNNGTLHPPSSGNMQVSNIRGLAVGASKHLYALHTRTGVDTILHFCLQAWNPCVCPSTTQWKVIYPAAPYILFDTAATICTLSGLPIPCQYVGGLTQSPNLFSTCSVCKWANNYRCLTTDSQGNLFTRLPITGHPDTIYKFEPKPDACQTDPQKYLGTWRVLPPALKQWWVRFNFWGFYFPWYNSTCCLCPSPFVHCLDEVHTSPSGTMYARWHRCGLDSVYVFQPGCDVAGKVVVPGNWTITCPVCKIYWSNSNPAYYQYPPCWCNWWCSVQSGTFDQVGHLAVNVHQCSVDSLLIYQGFWCVMPPIPNKHWKITKCFGIHFLCPMPATGWLTNIKTCCGSGVGGGGLSNPCKWAMTRRGSR